MNRNIDTSGTTHPILVPALFLAVIGLAVFVVAGISPWGWPDLDMATYYKNVDQPGFIVGDFLTACFGESNGRAIFGTLTAWPIRMGLDWYRTLYLWMLLNSALMPMAVFLGLQSALPIKNNRTAIVLFAFVLIAILLPGRVAMLNVAWWGGWGNHFHPSMFSITLMCFGVFFLSSGRTASKVVGSLMIFLSALAHPAYALGGGMFFALLLIVSREHGRLALLLLSMLCGLVFIKVYSASGALSAAAYSQYFSWLHPEHYIPSHFAAMGNFAWYLPVIFLLSSFLFCGIAIYLLGRRAVSLAAFGCALLYATSLLVQYALVQLYPVSTAILLISPARFTAYGYWMLAVCAALLFSIASHSLPLLPQQIAARFSADIQETLRKRTVQGALAILAVVCTSTLVSVGLERLKTPYEEISADEKDVVQWISGNTQPGDEIASPGFLPVAIPLLTGRGTYEGNGFPFEDRCLAENYARYVNISGPPNGPKGRMEAPLFYNNLDITRFSTMTPRPDWVVMERTSPGAVRSLSIGEASFANDTYVVFRIE